MDSSAPGAPPDDSPVPPPLRGRHRLRWFWGIVAALVLGGAAAIVFSDAPEPDLSDLAFEPVKVADEDNLYVQLVAHGKRLGASPLVPKDEVDTLAPAPAPDPSGSLFGSPAPEPPLLLDRLLAGEGWTPERLARLSGPLEEVARIARELHRMPVAQGTIPQDIHASMPYTDTRFFGELLRLAVWARYHSGRPAEAIELALVGLDLGRAVRDARGPLADYVVGIVLTSWFQTQLQQIAARPEATPELLNRLLQASLPRESLADGYAHSLKNDFRVYSAFLSRHNAAEAARDMAPNRVLKGIAETRLLFPLVYKRNLTVSLYADSVREEIVAAARDTLHGPEPTPAYGSALIGGCAHCEAISPMGLLRPINAHGRSLLAYISPTYSSIRRSRISAHTRQSLLQAYLALRLHHLETGSLPAALDDLVPSRLPALPRDFADGAPVRYSREARTVWSVGASADRPLQVTQPDQRIAPSELFYRLDFAAPAADAGAALVPAPASP